MFAGNLPSEEGVLASADDGADSNESDQTGTQVEQDSRAEPTDSESEVDEEYEVETLLRHRKVPRKGMQYLIKWKGAHTPTWEHERNVVSKTLIEDYWRRWRIRHPKAKCPV